MSPAATSAKRRLADTQGVHQPQRRRSDRSRHHAGLTALEVALLERHRRRTVSARGRRTQAERREFVRAMEDPLAAEKAAANCELGIRGDDGGERIRAIACVEDELERSRR